MNAVALKAHFDGKHICLDEPFELQPDSKLVVMVVRDLSEVEECEELHEMGRQSLARAYGDNEPDYSDYLGKIPPE